MKEVCEEILSFWFGDDAKTPLSHQSLWFKKDEAMDVLIRERFEALLAQAVKGELDAWLDQPRSLLAYVVLLDQLSRNMYRDTPQAFAQDALALRASKHAIEKGFDKQLSTIECTMLYMPFMHAEDIKDQQQGIALFAALHGEAEEALKSTVASNLVYMQQHADIIEQFGRFPHRNVILSRESSHEEQHFLTTPNSSF